LRTEAADDNGPWANLPVFDQAVHNIRIFAGERLGDSAVVRVKDDQGAVGGVGKGPGQNDFAASVGLAGEAKMFVAIRCAASDEVVDDFIEESKVGHRISPQGNPSYDNLADRWRERRVFAAGAYERFLKVSRPLSAAASDLPLEVTM